MRDRLGNGGLGGISGRAVLRHADSRTL
jgi:hypothetical protein